MTNLVSESEIAPCFLFLLPYVTEDGFLKSKNEKVLTQAIKDYGISNYVIAYAYPHKAKSISRTDIKNNIWYVEELISIISPKAIVIVGEEPFLIFMGRKPKAIDVHATEVTKYMETPILSIMGCDYYFDRNEQGDRRYKASIYREDWKFIREQYEKLVEVCYANL